MQKKNNVQKFFLFSIFFVTITIYRGQSVGINTQTPEASAILDLESFVGTKATATATISNGAVTGITITNPGEGYTFTPSISFVGGGAVLNGGTRATATVTVSAGKVTNYSITNGGSGYTSAPTVVFGNNNKGLLIPRLNIASLSNFTSPVNNPVDGLLAYNIGSPTNSNEKSIYYFDSIKNSWVSGLKSVNTPRIAYLDVTGDTSVLTNLGAGYTNVALQNKPKIAPVSNIAGLDIYTYNNNQYGIILPQGDYVVEINFNLTTPPPSSTDSNYYIMGYFIDLYNDNYNNSTKTITSFGSDFNRKENVVTSKLNTNHFVPWMYFVHVPTTSNPTQMYCLRMFIGRMQDSTYNTTAIIKDIGSYIKISKIK